MAFFRDMAAGELPPTVIEGGLSTSSKLDPEWEFLIRLHGLGVRAADRWLSTHARELGVCSTLDLERI